MTMPLSEYEQRVLDQMERSLASDDPKLASALTSRSRQTGRVLLGILAVVAGLGLLVGAVAAAQIWLGIAGFLIMLFGGYLAMTKSRKAKSDGGQAQSAEKNGRSAKTRGRRPAKPSFMERMDERWQRRRSDGDF